MQDEVLLPMIAPDLRRDKKRMIVRSTLFSFIVVQVELNLPSRHFSTVILLPWEGLNSANPD